MVFGRKDFESAARSPHVQQARPFMAGQVAESYAYAEDDDDPAFAPRVAPRHGKVWMAAGLLALFAIKR